MCRMRVRAAFLAQSVINTIENSRRNVSLSLRLKGRLEGTTGGLEIVVQATKTTRIKHPIFENFGVWVLLF